jgi:hypothetical protein
MRPPVLARPRSGSLGLDEPSRDSVEDERFTDTCSFDPLAELRASFFRSSQALHGHKLHYFFIPNQQFSSQAKSFDFLTPSYKIGIRKRSKAEVDAIAEILLSFIKLLCAIDSKEPLAACVIPKDCVRILMPLIVLLGVFPCFLVFSMKLLLLFFL